MKLLDTFAPHILYLTGISAGILAFLGFATHRLTSSLLVLLLVCVALWISYTGLFLLLVAFLPLDGWLKAKSTKNWEKEAKGVNTAVILGFGYEKNVYGDMIAGKANEELLNWTIENTQATVILVQEGIWVAACDSIDEKCTVSGRQIRRIHQHDPKKYINTLDTAYCAIQAMETQSENEAVLVTHNLQLQRAVWDFETVKRARGKWQDYRFIVPEVPNISYPRDSVHWQTRSEWAWRIVELLISRPKDFLSRVPNECKAPLPTISGNKY